GAPGVVVRAGARLRRAAFQVRGLLLAATALALLPGTASSEERLLVLSLHSGEVLAGENFPIHALEATTARALAARVPPHNPLALGSRAQLPARLRGALPPSWCASTTIG